MKFLIAQLLLVSVAHAGSLLSCQTFTRGEYDMSLTIVSKDFYTYENTLGHGEGVEIIGVLKDLTVTAVYTDYDGVAKTQTGRRDYVQNDRAYRPRQYKNTLRFNFNELTNVDTFGDFSPMDSCTINFMVPKDAQNLSAFKAFAIVSCDHGGGSQTLTCALER